MWLVTIAWAAGEVTMRRSPRRDRLGRACWTIGLALALLHVVLAFEYVHAWSHEAAIAATVRQSDERFGIGWRGGIYVNYVFLAIWLADVGWWWLAPASHRTRARWLERTRLAFFVFMFVNGAVIFAAWPGRLIGIAAVVIVLTRSAVVAGSGRMSSA